ncbi:hypothetical protein N7481_005025 [Penicillium waksmanii]|uniref:uncharacterized protein n=1 Tax=Penicillium waksmanii TaxID=69791 RepID=UPI00254784EA|nr:uncharacterized protein N7481_005025 [Penicillium waksmanii]KAJ5982926.1 hypothetical protein N7481_005025 [Penicillium waksmanii]
MIPLLLFDDGDTLVYIDPPPENTCRKLPSSSTTTHRIHSEKLLSTGSAYLTKLFHPRWQKRVAKQRGFHQDSLPRGIKYLLDLTPPILEEDAIILLTEVSCPSGIRMWASQRLLWRLPASCVGGKDICEPVEDAIISQPSSPPPTSPAEEDIEAPPKDPGFAGFQDEGLADAPNIEKPTSLPVEYSPVRHREGIEHILHVLEGLSISLDTPSKLWTFFAIAKVFDLATVPAVSGYILSWFYQTTNTKFIEIHPEIAYRVACGIKAPELCHHAFLALVGDEALLNTIRTADLRPRHNYIENFAHSRMNGFLDDIEVQRIEYASKSFADDLIDQFLHLAGAEMPWLDENPEYQKLIEHREQCSRDRAAVNYLTGLLKDFVRYRIYSLLKRTRDPIRSSDAVPAITNLRMNSTFHKEHVLQRLIGRSFWYSLLNFSLLSDTDFPPELMYHQAISDIGEGLLAFKGHERARIDYFHRTFLESEANNMNQKIEAEAKRLLAALQNSQVTLPMRPLLPKFAGPVASSSAFVPSTEPNPHSKPFVFRPREAQNWNGEQSSSESVMASNPSPNTALDMFGPPSLGETGRPRQRNQNYQAFPEYSNFPENSAPIQPHQSLAQGKLLGSPAKSFDLTLFLVSANTSIRQIARGLLFPTEGPSIPITSIDTLSCLSEKQLNLLPLWAGGNDDGSGGVFQDQDIPIMETGGFSTPGPAVHTGSNATTEDSFSDIGPSDSRSTINGASNRATLSHQTEVQSLGSSFDEGSIMQADIAEPEVHEGYEEPLESEYLVKSSHGEFNFEMDGADSDSNSTLMGHQSDINGSDDEDMEYPENTSDDDDDDDDDNDDHDKIMSDAASHGFEIVDGRL